MSHIPSKAMHHAHTDAPTPVVAPAPQQSTLERVRAYARATPTSALIGAGAGLAATVAGVASLLLLRSSTPKKKPAKRRAPSRKRSAAA